MTNPALFPRRRPNSWWLQVLAGILLALDCPADAAERKASKGSRATRGGEVAEVEKALRETREQLDRTRDSLHEAHKELGFKAEQISRLQIQVKAMEKQLQTAVAEIRKLSQQSVRAEQLRKSLERERKTNEQLRSQLDEVKQASAKALAEARRKAADPGSGKRSAKMVAEKETPRKGGQPVPRGKSVTLKPVLYDRLSAVSYPGRDRVLEEFRVILKAEPRAVFYLTGHADDARWDQTNRDISVNRARFLANHLQFHGIPAEKLRVKGEGSRKSSKVGNRRVEIVVKVP